MNDTQVQGELIAAYKELLRGYLEKRPSGLRKRISDAIGTNRSFVSQITNPKYTVPIPSNYVHQIIEVCHLSPAERTQFIAAYLEAHPGQTGVFEIHQAADSDLFTIDLAKVTDLSQRALIKQTLKFTAETLIALAVRENEGTREEDH